MFFLMMHAHSKWLEVHMTNSSTSAVTIELMRSSFAALVLPGVVVPDSEAIFMSDEFGQFRRKNRIRHVRIPTYHPTSNGLIDRVIQTFKGGLKKLTEGTLSTRVARFLFKYRITPQSSTGISPAELLYGRRLWSQLDQLHPDLGRKVQQSQERQKQNTTFVHSYASSKLEIRFLPAIMDKNLCGCWVK